MTRLGTDINRNRLVSLTPAGRRQGTYVVGINGSGKTNLLMAVALQDMEAGDGLCVLDPHGDLTKDLLARVPRHRVKDVILFDPADMEFPFGLNLFECLDPTDPRLVELVSSEVILTFKKLFAAFWGPRMEDVIRHTVLALIEGTADATMLDMLPFLTSYPARQRYLEGVQDPVIRHYWDHVFPSEKAKKTQDEWTSSTLNKLGRFLTNPVIRNIVSQPKSSFDFRRVMDEGKILLVNLSKGELGEDSSALLGSVLVGKILISALSRAALPFDQRRPWHLVVDEYHSFATESFPTLQSEARKYGIDTLVAHQYRGQLDGGERGGLNHGSTLNVGNFILFRLTGPDAQEMALAFDNTPPPGDPEIQQVAYKSGRPGILRGAGDYVLKDGRRRPYGDVEAETANLLANQNNFQAHCRLIGDEGRLHQCVIKTDPIAPSIPSSVPGEIREASRLLAMPRADIEERVRLRWKLEEDQTEKYD